MPTDAKTIAALREALDDEYRARAIYRKVIATFGEVRPFVNIVEAEDRHAQALLRLFDRFGIEAPADSWPSRVTAAKTLMQACRDAIAAEIENEAMYERLLKQVSDPAVQKVLRRLQLASQERHLPAFRRRLERETMRSDHSDPPATGAPGRARMRRRGNGNKSRCSAAK